MIFNISQPLTSNFPPFQRITLAIILETQELQRSGGGAFRGNQRSDAGQLSGELCQGGEEGAEGQGGGEGEGGEGGGGEGGGQREEKGAQEQVQDQEEGKEVKDRVLLVFKVIIVKLVE